MVNFAFVLTVATALASPIVTNSHLKRDDSIATYSDWVDKLIAHPDADHMSVAEVHAHVEARNAAGLNDHLEKRGDIRCNSGQTVRDKGAKVQDALNAIQKLAKRAGNCSNPHKLSNANLYARTNNAAVIGTRGTRYPWDTVAPCNVYAKWASDIVSACPAVDGKVRGYNTVIADDKQQLTMELVDARVSGLNLIQV